MIGKQRIDCIIIWGHGFPYVEEILEEIRSAGFLQVVRIVRLKFRTMKKFVNKVYSYDYAPIAHLRNKIRYLDDVKPEVLCVFLNNICPEEDLLGTGAFRHMECIKLKALKSKIRAKYNPYENEIMTHNHVIHSTDREEQVHHILRACGEKRGVQILKGDRNFFNIPYYIPVSNQIQIEEVGFDELYCSILQGSTFSYSKQYLPVDNSPQYLALSKDPSIYQEYITRFRGTALTVDYSLERFFQLKDNFQYLSKKHNSSFVIVKKMSNNVRKYVIADGLHRAAIHRFLGNDKIKVCVI